jgi:4-amino-4-deoxy-L-arabinose transferase-like glycosyltransferase
MNRILPIHWIFFGALEVVCFFYFSNQWTQKWKLISNVSYSKKLFQTALIIRLFYVFFSFYFYEYMTGAPFEFQTGDAFAYHNEAIWINELFKNNEFLLKYPDYIGGNYSDAGYPVYLSIIYFISDNSILFARIIKALLSAYSCILIYKLCRNNFGESTGRIAGIIAVIFPSFIYYCGLHLKETEMTFLVVLFLERADNMFRSKILSYSNLALVIGIAFSLFFFRTVVGVSAFFALFSVVFLTKNRFVKTNKKTVIGVWVIVALLLFFGSTLQNEIVRYWGEKETNLDQSMQARAALKTGNKLAKYGAASVFAPFMLFAPFPTLVNVDTQQNQMMLNGGFFVKNILGFFVLLALIVLIRRKEYKKHIFILSFLLVYLVILALSKFAISERFHMPAYPLLIVFSAYGISQLNQKNVKYYIPYLIFLALIIIGWNWFKLAGRGAV